MGKGQTEPNVATRRAAAAALLLILLSLFSAAVRAEPPPRYIAVLPARGEGTEAERNDIRLAVHNALGASNFDLVKPAEVERLLALLDEPEHPDLGRIPPRELSQRLRVDGLIYIDVTKLQKLYAAAYAHYKVALQAGLYDARQDKVIWQFKGEETEREGGISTNPVGILATAISSSRVLTDAVRLQLTDTLARHFASAIPQPPPLMAKPPPPQIGAALSNAAQGPFRAGQEIQVLLQAEAGLNVQFRFEHRPQWHPLASEEAPAAQQPGSAAGQQRYIGRYVVQPGDDIAMTGLILQLQKGRQPAIEWPVAGRFAIATRAPETVRQLFGLHEAERVQLNWQPPEHILPLRYRVSRADTRRGKFKVLGEVELANYSDTAFDPGKTYSYRVEALDTAGNHSDAATVRVETVRYGPTDIEGDIRADQRLKAAGSPYRIRGRITVIQNATLRIDPGALVEFLPGAVLSVQGRLLAAGNEQAPIIFRGENWRIDHEFSAAKTSQYQYVHWQGKGGRITATNSALAIEHCYASDTGIVARHSELRVAHCVLEKSDTALTIEGGRVSVIDSVLQHNGRALANQGGEPRLEALTFVDNNLHLHSDRPLALRQPLFPEESYLSLRSRLKGNIEIDWDSLPPEKNLERQWLLQVWRRVAEAIREKNWVEARKRFAPIVKNVEQVQVADLDETFYLLQNPAARVRAMERAVLLPAMVELRRQQSRGDLLWIPSNPADMAELSLAYFQYYHPRALTERLLDYRNVAFDKAVVVRQPLTSIIGEAPGQLVLVDAGVLTEHLKAAGFIRRPPLFEKAELITPPHKSLCRAVSPWQYGERLLDVNNPLMGDNCLALRINVLDSQLLYLLGRTLGGGWKQLLPDRCHSTGLLTNRIAQPGPVVLPQNGNQQPVAASVAQWPYDHYIAIAIESAEDEHWIGDILRHTGSHCGGEKVGDKLLLPELRQQLEIVDKRSGGRVQWNDLAVKIVR